MKQINGIMTSVAPAPTKTEPLGTSSRDKSFQRLLRHQLTNKGVLDAKAKSKNFGMDKLANQVSPKTYEGGTTEHAGKVTNVGKGKNPKQQVDKTQPETTMAELSEEIAKLLEGDKLSAEDLAQLTQFLDQIEVLAQMPELLVQLQAILSQLVGQGDMANEFAGLEAGFVINQQTEANLLQLMQMMDKMAQMPAITSGAISDESQLGASVLELGFQLQQLLAEENQDPQLTLDQLKTIIARLQQVVQQVTDDGAQQLDQANQLIQKLITVVGEESLLVQHLQKLAQGTTATIGGLASGDLDLTKVQGLVARVAVLQEALAKQSNNASATATNQDTGNIPELTVVNTLPSAPGSNSSAGENSRQNDMAHGDDELAQEPVHDSVAGNKTKGATGDSITSAQRELNVPFKVLMENATPFNPVQHPAPQPQELAQINQVKQPVLTPKLQENIWNQVVEKAVLVTAGKDTDMIIKLKPEHLGKVSLQISMENGVLTAKFMAESRMVKEVIEANINNLKQNLTNQGIKVDQVSVQVGSDSGQPQWSRQPNQNHSTGGKDRNNGGNQELDEMNPLEAANEPMEYGEHLVGDGRVNYVI